MALDWEGIAGDQAMTIALLETEVKRLRYLIEKTYYINDAGCICQRVMDNLLADVAQDVLESFK